MHSSKPVSTPMAMTGSLTALDGALLEDPSLYRSVVGSLQYLSFTRPDLAFAVNRMCQYMHSSRVPHWQAVKRILRYLRYTSDFGLRFARSSSSGLAAFSAAYWAGCPDDQRSTSFLWFPHLISWSSRKQQLLPVPAPRLNTRLWLMQRVSCFGFNPFSVILVSLFIHLRSYGVII